MNLKLGDIVEVIDDTGWHNRPWVGCIAIVEPPEDKGYKFSFRIILAHPSRWSHDNFHLVNADHKCLRVIGHIEPEK